MKGDLALVDMVTAFGVANDVEGPEVLSALPFGKVVTKLVAACQAHPNLVVASKEVRAYYDICHWQCHMQRVRDFVAADCVWGPGQGPNMTEGRKLSLVVNNDTGTVH